MKTQSKKYTVKPPKDLTSKYDAYMHQRHLDKIQADKNRLQEEENKRIAVILKNILNLRTFQMFIIFRKLKNHYLIHFMVFEYMLGYWFYRVNVKYLKLFLLNQQLAMVNQQMMQNIWGLKVFGIIKIYGLICKIVRMVVKLVLTKKKFFVFQIILYF